MKEKKKITYEELNKKGIVQKGFVQLDNELRVKISVDCGPYGLALYIALLSHYNKTTTKCFPSIDTLARETGISKRKVSDVLNDLSDNGYIIIRSGGTHHSNSYWFPYHKDFQETEETLGAYRRKRLNPNKKNKKNAIIQEEDYLEDDEEYIF